VWAWPFGEEVGWRSVEDGVADIVIGCARLEAEAGGELALGEAAEFPESDHTGDFCISSDKVYSRDYVFITEGEETDSWR
jgi:hypothetical protein